MKTLVYAASILLVPLLAPDLGTAQTAPVVPGETVLVSWRDRGSMGAANAYRRRELVVVRSNALQLIGRDDGHIYLIERGTITSVRRRIGTRPATAPEIVAGSAIGFGAAFLLGAMSSPGDRADMGLSSGVLVGAPLGALVAWVASRSRGIYEDVPLPDLRVARRAGNVRIELAGRLATP
jgi:hypothetical protein